MSPGRAAVGALLAAAWLAGCGSGGVRAAIEDDLADIDATVPGGAACVASATTEALTEDELAAIGVTSDGIDIAVLTTRSFDLDPASVDYWDAFFGCVPVASVLGTSAGSGLEPEALACLAAVFEDDPLLRLTLVFGSTGDAPPPVVADVGDRLTEAMAGCGAPTG